MFFTQGQPGSPTDGKPLSTGDLSATQHMVVWSIRRWVLGLRENRGSHWSLVWNEFAGRLGSHEGRRAMAGFVELMRCLQRHARRRLRLYQPCCAALGADEVCLLRLVGASQEGHDDLARRLAAWLVREEGVEPLTLAATGLAETFLVHGLLLPDLAPAPSVAEHIRPSGKAEAASELSVVG